MLYCVCETYCDRAMNTLKKTKPVASIVRAIYHSGVSIRPVPRARASDIFLQTGHSASLVN